MMLTDRNGERISEEKLLEEVTRMMYGTPKTLEQVTEEFYANPRGQGNQYFKQGNYYMALLAYNLALEQCYDDDAEKSLCYANRAACYLEMKFFKNCLHNLDLAEPHYPAEKIKKLHERREKCFKLMAVERDEGQIKFEHPFDKLSYPANPKLPFFIDAVELKQDKLFGRHLITSQDLKAGDVIALIDRSLKCRDHDQRSGECANCTKPNNFDLFASEKCEQALFCSQSCLDGFSKIEHEVLLEMRMPTKTGQADMHDVKASQLLVMHLKVFMQILNAFDSIADMHEFVEENEKEPKTVFDFDWSDLNESNFLKNILCCILTAQINPLRKSKNSKKSVSAILGHLSTHLEFSQLLSENIDEHEDFIESILDKLMGALESRKTASRGAMRSLQYLSNYFHPCMLLLNHSCDPNIFTTIVDENKVAWIANRPIKAGQQIFICNTAYNSEFYSNDVMYGVSLCEYKNSCVPCQKGWRKSLDPNVYATGGHWYPITVPFEKLMQCREESVRKVKSVAKCINKNFTGYDSDVKVREDVVKKLQEFKRHLEVLSCVDLHMRKFTSASFVNSLQ